MSRYRYDRIGTMLILESILGIGVYGLMITVFPGHKDAIVILFAMLCVGLILAVAEDDS